MKLSFRPYNLQLKYPFKIANYSRTTTPVVLVELEHNGIVGYGEASLPQYLGATQETVMQFLSQLDLAQFNDPTEIDKILDYVDSFADGNTAAKASIDIALHDLLGKLLNKPCYEFFGLNPSETPLSTYTIGMDSDEVVIQKTREVINDFKILKVKLGGEDDKRMIQTIRSVTNLPIAVDANQGWKDRNEALDMIFWLKEQGIVLIEQPMDKQDLDNTAWLTSESPLPIYADESVQRLADMERLKGVFSGINIKLMKCTGMHEAWKMIQKAPSLGLDVMLGCMTETSCAISAAAHLSPSVQFADLDGAMLITNDCFEGAKIVDGKISLNNRVGLGLLTTKNN